MELDRVPHKDVLGEFFGAGNLSAMAGRIEQSEKPLDGENFLKAHVGLDHDGTIYIYLPPEIYEDNDRMRVIALHEFAHIYSILYADIKDPNRLPEFMWEAFAIYCEWSAALQYILPATATWAHIASIGDTSATREAFLLVCTYGAQLKSVLWDLEDYAGESLRVDCNGRNP